MANDRLDGLVEAEAQIVAHVLQMQAVILHLTLGESGLSGNDILIGRGLAELAIHGGEPGLDAIAHLIEGASTLLNRVLLFLVERLLQLAAVLIHAAELFADLRALLAGRCRIEGRTRGGAAHVAGAGAQLLQALVAGAVPVTLRGGCLRVKAVPLHLPSLIEAAEAGALPHAAAALGLAHLTAASATAASRTLCKDQSRSQKKEESKREEGSCFHDLLLSGKSGSCRAFPLKLLVRTHRSRAGCAKVLDAEAALSCHESSDTTERATVRADRVAHGRFMRRIRC